MEQGTGVLRGRIFTSGKTGRLRVKKTIRVSIGCPVADWFRAATLCRPNRLDDAADLPPHVRRRT